MTHKEDDDVKIFQSSCYELDEDFPRQVADLNHQRQTGNLKKANELGDKLFAIIEQEGVPFSDLNPEFREGKMPVKVGVLAMFAMEAALNIYLPSTQLSTITIAKIHQLLADAHSPVYEKVLESPAYSFYFLSLRKGGEDGLEDIGKAFAEHCRHEGDEKYIAYGRHIYETIQTEVQHQIQLMGFAD